MDHIITTIVEKIQGSEVVITTKINTSKDIFQAKYKEFSLDKHGHGILFVQQAAEVHRLFHDSK